MAIRYKVRMFKQCLQALACDAMRRSASGDHRSVEARLVLSLQTKRCTCNKGLGEHNTNIHERWGVCFRIGFNNVPLLHFRLLLLLLPSIRCFRQNYLSSPSSFPPSYRRLFLHLPLGSRMVEPKFEASIWAVGSCSRFVYHC